MGFRDVIEEMQRMDPSIRGGALAGSDGLTVEEWQAVPGACDMAAICAEMVQFFRESGRIARENGLGEALEITLTGDRGLVFLHRVNEEYFLVVVTEPGALPGKWRFLLGRGARRAKEML